MLLTSRRHNPASFKVITNNHNIFPEDNLKHLGVLLDNKSSWKPHVQKVKTQPSRTCGILSKLKHYTTLPVLKVVYNSLIHPYLNYPILNWGRASNETILPLIKLQNKAIKIINPTNTGPLEEHFQHLDILCLPKLYFSVGKFMHSYHNKLLPNHFDEYFIPLSAIHYHSTRLATSKNLFLLRVNSSSGKCSLKFIGPKVWSSIPEDIKFSTTFTFKPFNAHAGHCSGRYSFGHNSPAAATEEVFKPSTDSASLLVPRQKKFQFWVWGSLGGTSQVGVF